jgi:hypothetical protein
MNMLIVTMLVLNLILLPLAAYCVVRTLSHKLDSNARWHRQVLIKELDVLLLEHENRFADRLSHTVQR